MTNEELRGETPYADYEIDQVRDRTASSAAARYKAAPEELEEEEFEEYEEEEEEEDEEELIARQMEELRQAQAELARQQRDLKRRKAKQVTQPRAQPPQPQLPQPAPIPTPQNILRRRQTENTRTSPNVSNHIPNPTPSPPENPFPKNPGVAARALSGSRLSQLRQRAADLYPSERRVNPNLSRAGYTTQKHPQKVDRDFGKYEVPQGRPTAGGRMKEENLGGARVAQTAGGLSPEAVEAMKSLGLNGFFTGNGAGQGVGGMGGLGGMHGAHAGVGAGRGGGGGGGPGAGLPAAMSGMNAMQGLESLGSMKGMGANEVLASYGTDLYGGESTFSAFRRKYSKWIIIIVVVGALMFRRVIKELWSS